ncbi:MAG: hypothetical protein ABI574_05185 [Burkholderiales bacterium]
MADIHLHLIAYDDASRRDCEPAYAVLDNHANPRPDWREYWPIRDALLNQSLDEQAWYGFFSHKFQAKTGLTHAQAVAFVEQVAARPEGADVVMFSPQFDMSAFFLNVFEQAELFDPGFIDVCQAFFAEHGWVPDLRSMVMDARQVVFSNFFVARPAFWREWLRWNERLFAVCEDPAHPLHAGLTQPTLYDGVPHPNAVQRKVFLMERMTSLLLASDARWRTACANPVRFVWSESRLRDFPAEALMSNALKASYRDSGWSEYLSAFAKVRKVIREQTEAA